MRISGNRSPQGFSSGSVCVCARGARRKEQLTTCSLPHHGLVADSSDALTVSGLCATRKLTRSDNLPRNAR